MATITPIRIPVCDADGMITERVDACRARRLALAPNATLVHEKRTGRLVRILMRSTDDELLEDANHGNPRVYSHNKETRDNPVLCWTLKRIPKSTRDIFRAVTLDLAA